MSQFKPGDLALIAGSDKGISPNIGMAVELTLKLRTNDSFTLPDGRQAVNRGPECWVVKANGISAAVYNICFMDLGGIALVLERHLVPLRGDCEPEQQKSQEVSA